MQDPHPYLIASMHSCKTATKTECKHVRKKARKHACMHDLH